MTSRRHGKPSILESTEMREIPLGDADAELLGALGDYDERTGTVMLIPLKDIRPDPVQPRRGMPEYLRDEWVTSGSDTIGTLLTAWLDAANLDVAPYQFVINPRAFLTGEDLNLDADAELGPYATTLIKLFKDASTVREHGLEHPITVSKYQDGWMIQSGERRTLMHWALTYWLEDTKFSEISAIEVPQRSPWRQAAENNARSDLTAIERARQLALLLMDLYGPTRDFASYSELPGQAFYQQAAELSAPRSGGLEKILDAMGFASRAQLSQYRRLLTLPEEAWQLADEHRWSEKKIRTMFQVAQTPPEGWTEDQYLCYLARVEAGLEVLPDDRNDQLLTGVNNSRSKSSASQTPRATKTSHDDETDHPSFDENSGDHRVVIRGDDAPYADGNPPRDFNSLTARAQQIAIQQQRQRSPLFAAIADELQTARDLLTPDSLVDLSAHDRALLREQIASLITLLTPNAIDETKFIFSEAANLPLRPADWRGATGADFQEVQELKRRALARIGDLDEFLKTLR